MNEKNENHNIEGGLNLPERLLQDLKDIYAPAVQVPRETDEKMLLMAERRCSAQARMRKLSVLARAAAAVAAIVVVSFLMIPSRSSVTGDVDGNGKVNIVDAFCLARGIRDDSDLNPGWDVNGDGAVDDADVHFVAMASVSLAFSGNERPGG